MEWLLSLLIPVALAHPGHGAAPPCDPKEDEGCVVEKEDHGRSEIHLGEILLEQGLPQEAAVRLAKWAEMDAEAATLLARALEELGDAEGAKLARERAARLGK